MSSITVELSEETERILRKVAHSSGQSLEAYLRHMAEREAAERESEPGRSFDEILEPVREGFHESGLTEEELTDLLREARDEVHRDRRTGDKPS